MRSEIILNNGKEENNKRRSIKIVEHLEGINLSISDQKYNGQIESYETKMTMTISKEQINQIILFLNGLNK